MTKASGVTEENAPTLFAPVHVHALGRPLGEGEREGAALTARDFGKLAPARALVVRELLCARAMPEWLDSSVEPATILALLRALLPPSDGPPAADESDEAKEAGDAAAIEAGCSLWDMSANPALAQFMCEHGLLALLLRPIAQRAGHSGRLIEVALGCLANVVVDPALCASLGERDEAAALLCGVLLDCADAAVLTELVRLLATALSTSPRHCRGGWLRALRAAPVVQQASHCTHTTAHQLPPRSCRPAAPAP